MLVGLRQEFFNQTFPQSSLGIYERAVDGFCYSTASLGVSLGVLCVLILTVKLHKKPTNYTVHSNLIMHLHMEG